jgi:hypothetical protein
MQCPDCKRLRHVGECEPVYDYEIEQFYADMELERAKEIVRAASASPRLKEERHGKS